MSRAGNDPVSCSRVRGPRTGAVTPGRDSSQPRASAVGVTSRSAASASYCSRLGRCSAPSAAHGRCDQASRFRHHGGRRWLSESARQQPPHVAPRQQAEREVTGSGQHLELMVRSRPRSSPDGGLSTRSSTAPGATNASATPSSVRWRSTTKRCIYRAIPTRPSSCTGLRRRHPLR